MKTWAYIITTLLCVILLTSFIVEIRWGFFGHRRINRLAVFTLSPAMMPLYKTSIEFLTEHAVDADKRRYAVKDEAPRHFIDLDRWYKNGVLQCPHQYEEALSLYTDFLPAEATSSESLFGRRSVESIGKEKYLIPEGIKHRDTNLLVELKKFMHFISNILIPISNREDKVILKGKLINHALNKKIAKEELTYIWIDTFSIHGILPYQLPDRYKKLVQAFSNKDRKSILRLSADIGHYIGDAHVPLHTTSNYNGQMTNQMGLHAFWESRIPELFADNEYDFVVGKAQYINNINTYIWDVVLKSHSYVDSVLLIEKRLSLSYPSDQQYCFDERTGTMVRTQCEAYAKAYQQALKGMVESRMRDAIVSVGSVWYSAWIDAGQPNLFNVAKSKEPEQDPGDLEMDKAYKGGTIIGRPEN